MRSRGSTEARKLSWHCSFHIYQPCRPHFHLAIEVNLLLSRYKVSSMPAKHHTSSSARIMTSSAHAKLPMASAVPSMPFLRLERVQGGEAVTARILSYALDVVDVFLPDTPKGELHLRCCEKVGPSTYWLSRHGHGTQASSTYRTWDPVRQTWDTTGPSNQQPGPTSPAPSWHYVRIEVKLRVVCRLWQKLVDSRDMVDFSNVDKGVYTDLACRIWLSPAARHCGSRQKRSCPSPTSSSSPARTRKRGVTRTCACKSLFTSPSQPSRGRHVRATGH